MPASISGGKAAVLRETFQRYVDRGKYKIHIRSHPRDSYWEDTSGESPVDWALRHDVFWYKWEIIQVLPDGLHFVDTSGFVMFLAFSRIVRIEDERQHPLDYLHVFVEPHEELTRAVGHAVPSVEADGISPCPVVMTFGDTERERAGTLPDFAEFDPDDVHALGLDAEGTTWLGDEEIAALRCDWRFVCTNQGEQPCRIEDSEGRRLVQLPITAQPDRSLVRPRKPRYSFELRSESWVIRYGGEPVIVRSLRGIEMIARLLQTPGQAVGTHTLDTGRESDQPELATEGIAVLDPAAIHAAREALNNCPPGTPEWHKLDDYLRQSTRPGWKPRETGGTRKPAVDRVGNAIRDALVALRSADEAVAAHLETTLRPRRGSGWIYLPDREIEWSVKLGAAGAKTRSARAARSR